MKLIFSNPDSHRRTKDYQDFTTKSMPVARRRKFDVGDIWSNEVKCKICSEIIRSKNRHDFVTCACKSISVDGGSWYAKRVGPKGGTFQDYEERTIMFDHLEDDPKGGDKV